ncbi:MULTISPECIES: helix-turn-helix domain-containing protein [unclassified Enterococcus]|uniref:helix-turn-helix domain-containing protein n=1 Tax=unclassified Enterococcus TaxID=2608891 RepID=UPI001CE1368C|nr:MULTISPECIES: helix-turn-helix domain-containing protein [unclassified Enterococcus]MCA5013651.1 helix-turn-helix domain-containing protein [Enterococcus sp. S23]MCA5016901.1 helix-turn-helix domain-containing protein [Enterococcus sp. S22(2020)]
MLNFDIFDAETGKKLQLLYLLYKKEGWYSIDELVFDSHLERKSVLKYTKDLAEDLLKIESTHVPIQINFSKGRGVRFIGGQLGYLKAIPFISEQSVSLSLMKELFFQPNLSLDYFLQKYFVSESTIRRKVTHFNSIIKKYELKIKSVNRELSIEGSELQFRYLSYIVFWNVYRGMSWPFPTIDQQKILTFIETEMKTYSYLKDVSTANWSYMIAINLYRYNQKKEVTEEDLPNFSHQLNQEALTKAGIHDSILTSIQQNFHVSISEADFLCLLFQMRSGFLLMPVISKRLMAVHESLNTPVHQMYQLYLEVLQPDLSSADEQTKIAYHSVLYVSFLTDLLFPNFTTSLSGYDYTRYLKQNYPFLRSAMVVKFQELQKRAIGTGVSFKNEDMLVARFCEAHALIESPTKFSPAVYIQMETDLPIIMERIIAQQMESFLQPFYNISFVPSTASPDEVTIDLIIASTTSSLLKKRARDTPVVYINPGFSTKDLFNIITVIENEVEARRP